ncbi:MAG: polyprenyl synthetase family protein [Planctomycetes bacterium]|nr:polyprenyl synthetase family protein [Planctomycetota bacterium]
MGIKAPVDLDIIYRPIEAEMARLDAFLLDEFQAEEPFIHELLEHVAGFGGKRLRPALLFLCTRLVGAEVSDEAIRIGGVIEMVHTATLVHDDLLDGAQMRRRVDTVHERWGERPSILIGDFIYSKAFHLSTSVDGMAAALSEATNRICAGELLQIGSRFNSGLCEDTYFEIIRKKTAVLHALACELGGVFAGLDAARSEALGGVGMDLGMAFQVVDDCLDYAGEETVVGKSLGTDLRQGKLTLPLIYLRDSLDEADSRWLQKALSGPMEEAVEVRIHEMVRNGGVLVRSFERAQAFVQSARDALDEVCSLEVEVSDTVRQSLELAADFVTSRDL